MISLLKLSRVGSHTRIRAVHSDRLMANERSRASSEAHANHPSTTQFMQRHLTGKWGWLYDNACGSGISEFIDRLAVSHRFSAPRHEFMALPLGATVWRL